MVVVLLCCALQPFVTHAQYQWRYVDSLQTPRVFFSALYIGNNKILVMGGMTQSTLSNTTDSCEFISVDSGKVSPAPRMPIARAEFPALLSNDGNVIAIGGIIQATNNSGPVTAQVDLYNPSTNSWTTLGNLLFARRQHSAIFIDNDRILVVGGRRTDLSSIVESEIFNIRTGQSTRVADYLFPVNGAASETSINGNFMVFTGRQYGPGSWRDTSVIVYNAVNNTFARVSKLPEQIYHPAISKLWNGRTLMAGGSLSEGTPYVLSTNVNIENANASYTNVANLSQGTFWNNLCQFNTDSVLVIGGSTDSFNATSICSWFSLPNNQVSAGPTLNRPRMFFAAVSVPVAFVGGVPVKAKIYAISGEIGAAGILRSVEVLEPAPCTSTILAISAGPDQIVCPPADSILLNVSALRGTLPQTVRWTPSAGLKCPTCPQTRGVIPGSTQSYIVTATDSLGCVARDTVVINVINFAVDAGKDVVVCGNDSTTLRLTGLNGAVVKTQWLPKEGLSCDTCNSVKVHPSVKTTYYGIGTNINGCVGRDSVTVDVFSIKTNDDITICPDGDSAALKVSANGVMSRIRWTPRIGLSCDTCRSTKAKPMVTTDYVVSVVSASGCVLRDTVKVTVLSGSGAVKPGAPQYMCYRNDSALISVSGKVARIVWTPNTALRCDTCPQTIAKPSKTTTYRYIATDSSGCTSIDSVTVDVLPRATVEAFPDATVCTSTGVLLSVTGSYHDVEWSPPIGLSCTNCPLVMAVPPKRSIVYTVKARNGNSTDCDALDSVRIHYAPGLEDQIPSRVELCAGDTISYSLRFGGSVKWTPSTSIDCDTCKTIRLYPTKNTRYVVTGDSLGCISRDTIDVVMLVPTLSVSKDTAICEGRSVLLHANTNSATVLWSPSVGLSCTNCPHPIATPQQTTRYYVRTGGSCSLVDSVLIRILPKPVVQLTPTDTTICLGTTLSLQLGIESTSYRVAWQPNPELSCLNCLSPKATPQQSTSYRVTVSTQQGCDTTLTVNVRVVNTPDYSLLWRDTLLCSGSAVQVRLQHDGKTDFRWKPATAISCDTCPEPILQPTVSTTYYIYGGSGANCDKVDSLQVRVAALPTITISADTTICLGSSAQLHGMTQGKYEWSPATGLSCTDCANPLATPKQSTRYTLRVSSAEGCVRDSSVMVSVIPCSHDVQIAHIPIASFFVCDSGVTMVTIHNAGNSKLQIDSVTEDPNPSAYCNPADLISFNSKSLPRLLQAGEEVVFPLHIIPRQKGNALITLKLYVGDSTINYTIPIRSYVRNVNFSLPKELLTVTVDSLFVLPLSVHADSWQGIDVRDSIVMIVRYDSTVILYADSLKRGSALSNDWSVGVDKEKSDFGKTVFVAKGNSAIKSDGDIVLPYFRSMLSPNLDAAHALSAEVQLTGICAEPVSSGASVSISGCALALRRVSIGATAFGVHPIQPNPTTGNTLLIQYGIGFRTAVELRLYNAQGAEIQQLVSAEQEEGNYTLQFSTETLSSGMYMCVMKAAAKVYTVSFSVVR